MTRQPTRSRTRKANDAGTDGHTAQSVTNNTPADTNGAAVVFSSASVIWRTLTVTFDEALDEDSVPAASQFFVTVGADRVNVASGGVAVSGVTVTLTLQSAVTHGDTVLVRYTNRPPTRSGTSPATTWPPSRTRR